MNATFVQIGPPAPIEMPVITTSCGDDDPWVIPLGSQSQSMCDTNGHMWLYSGGDTGEIPEGMPCCCGKIVYRKPERRCAYCGQAVAK